MELQKKVTLLVICIVICLPIVQPLLRIPGYLSQYPSGYSSPYRSRYHSHYPSHNPFIFRYPIQQPLVPRQTVCFAEPQLKLTEYSYSDYEVIETTTPSPKYVCCPGYKEVVTENATRSKMPRCDPICTNCAHGLCIDREKCICNLGYTKDGETSGCIPTCGDGCPGGVCIKPGLCKLVPTFHANTCNTDSCLNGCMHEEICLCIDGYRKVNRTICAPFCEKPCQHGYCIEPNTCVCNEGYVFNETIKNCVPFCSKVCKGGKCVAPNVCECPFGSHLKTLPFMNWDLCLPESRSCKPCPNVTCTEKDYCKCGEGYLYLLDKCTAQCPNMSCANGFCSQPNRCSCFKNYQLKPDNKSSECVPICGNGCLKHGTCLNSTVCVCDTGYKLNGPMNCVPNCSKPCGQNKECVAPDECRCKEGYESVDDDCEPYCPQGCDNGYCILPNKCSCLNGFSEKDSKCVPYTTTDGAFDDGSGKITDASSGYPFRTNELGIWCSLATVNWTETDLRDVSFSLQLNKRQKRIFSCTSNKICQPFCSDESFDALDAGDGLIECEVPFDGRTAELKCYVKLLTGLTPHQFDQVGRCRPTVYFESDTVKFFLISSYFSYNFINKSVQNSQDCKLCPCSVARHVMISGQNLTVNLCPCDETSEAQYLKIKQDNGFVSSIYIGIFGGMVLSILVLLGIYLRYRGQVFILRSADNETDDTGVPYSRAKI